MSQNAVPLQWYDLETLELMGPTVGPFPSGGSDEGVSNGVLHGGAEDEKQPVWFLRSGASEVQVGVDDGGTPDDDSDDTPIYEDSPQVELLRCSLDNTLVESVARLASFGGLSGLDALAHNPWDPVMLFEPDDLFDQNGQQVRCSYLVEGAQPSVPVMGSGGYIRVWPLRELAE